MTTDTLTIRLSRPAARFRIVEEPSCASAPEPTEVDRELTDRAQADLSHLSEVLRRQREGLSQLVATINALAARLNDLHQQTVAHHRSDIAKLAVEIARKILTQRIDRGEYDIQAIVEEALKRAPARQNLVVHLHPEDLAACQQFQREDPDSQFAEVDLVADWSVARADCLVETPKGIVKSFVEEHLARIGEALERAQ